MNESTKSQFVSPAYGVTRVSIDELVSQKANPNQMNSKSWEALQTSIFNSGYTFPVICAKNTEYDPATEGMEKPSLIEHTDNNDNNVANDEKGMQVADDEISKFYKYRLIDGAHRSQIIRLGTYWFNNGYDHSEEWVNNQNIPDKPGNFMLAYLAWRENFTIPCVIRDIDATQQMSEEILHNTARGAHSLDSMKDIVYNLINVAGMSEEWVSQNLYLDLESIKRMQQLSGLKASFQDIDQADLAWTPESDDSYHRKLTAYLTREASKYIENYKNDHPDENIPTTGTAIEVAAKFGFGQEGEMKKHLDEYYAGEEARLHKDESNN